MKESTGVRDTIHGFYAAFTAGESIDREPLGRENP